MRRPGRLFVGAWLVAAATGCSLLYPFELPDGGDADAVDGAEGDAVDGRDDGGVCGNSERDPGEECDGDPERACSTSCGSTGIQACVDCMWAICTAPAESCNGDDDDCDTEIDEGYPCAAGAATSCTTPCGLAGSGICTDGCEPPARQDCAAAAEACNGCDDTREGTTDEGCACAAGWALEHPLAPGPESLQTVWIAGDGHGFAVGTNGVILGYDGTRWSRMTVPSAYNLRGVHALSGSFAITVGSSGAILWWRGATWDYDASGGTTYSLYGVWAVAEDDIWAVGANGTVRHWDGTVWNPVDAHTTRHLYRVWAWSSDLVYAVGSNGTVIRWDGTDWSSVSAAWMMLDWGTVWGPDADTLYVGGRDGLVARRDASGAWTTMPTGTIENIETLWGSGAGDVWAVGGYVGGVVLHSDGATWTEDRTAPWIDRRGPIGVAGSGPDDVFVVTRDGGILHYDGDSWRPMEGGVTASLHAVAGSSATDVVAVGSVYTPDGTAATAVLAYDGSRWTLPHWLAGGIDGQDVWTPGGGELWLVTGDVNVRHYTGTAWETLPATLPGMRLFAVHGVSADDVFVVGDHSAAGVPPVMLEWTGSAWSPLAPPAGLDDVDLLDVSALSADDVLAVGTGGTILRRRAGVPALDPLVSGTSETLRAVWMAAADDAFAVGDNGTILRWDGTTWTSMTGPADPWVGFALYAVWGSSADNVFAAGESGLLLRWNGTVWAPIVVDVPSSLTGVWGSSANDVFVAADDRSGKILHRCGPVW